MVGALKRWKVGLFTFRVECARVAGDVGSWEVCEYSFPFLRLPDQRELLEELAQRDVERVAREVEETEVLFRHHRVEVIPGDREREGTLLSDIKYT